MNNDSKSLILTKKKPIKHISSLYNKIKKLKIKNIPKVIQRVTIPFIKQSSVHIKSRYDLYKFFNKYLKKEPHRQCLTILDNNKFSICDNKIILEKRIGSKSKYGAVYLSKTNDIKSVNSVKTAIKVMVINKENENELNILKKCTKFFVNKETSHFPIIYNSFYCNIKNNNMLIPENINDKNYFIYLNELAGGDLRMFTIENNNYKNDKLIINTMIQVFIAILTFHKKIKYCHNDCHDGNFLFHKIKPGGYIKYKIKNEYYYLENMGYLWVIWDFGLADNSYINHFNYNDYSKIMYAFLNRSDGGWIENNYKTTDYFRKIARIMKNNIDNLNFSSKNQDEKIFKSLMQNTSGLLKLKDLPPNFTVYNKKAYILL
jgi:hypothetical protein